MPTNLLINSKTSGKFKRETIDGRSHIVTTMMPIRGDITMNKIYYPDKEVTASYQQLNMLPAPNGHPSVNGVAVPAFHPVANNKHNIGAFLRNPRKKGKRVFADLMIDEQVANQSDEGKELIRRIENKERVGVSTGLGIAQVQNKQGKDDFGKAYNRIGSGYQFDHVAVLLNEEAAGSHAGTELVLNEEGGEVLVYNAEWAANELSFSQIREALHELIRPQAKDTYGWVVAAYPDSKTFIYEIESKGARNFYKQTYAVDQNDNVALIDDKTEMVENPVRFIPKGADNKQVVSALNEQIANLPNSLGENSQFVLNGDKLSIVDNAQQSENQTEETQMDKNKLVLAIIGNKANVYTVADNDKLMAMSDDDLLGIVGNSEMTIDQAKEMVTNSGVDLEGYGAFAENKEEFAAWQKEKSDAREAKIDNIVANSEYTEEMLQGKADAELDLITNMLNPKAATRAPQGSAPEVATNAEQSAQCDYS